MHQLQHLKYGTGERLNRATEAMTELIHRAENDGSSLALYNNLKTDLNNTVYDILLDRYGHDQKRRRALAEIAVAAISLSNESASISMIAKVALVLKEDSGNDAAKSALDTALIEGNRTERIRTASMINRISNANSQD